MSSIFAGKSTNTELITPGGIILPATSSIMPEGVEPRSKDRTGADKKNETLLKVIEILGGSRNDFAKTFDKKTGDDKKKDDPLSKVIEILGGSRNDFERAGWAAVVMLTSIRDILKKQYDEFTLFFGIATDELSDKRHAAAKDGSNVEPVAQADASSGAPGGMDSLVTDGLSKTVLVFILLFLLSFRNSIMDALARIPLFLKFIGPAFQAILWVLSIAFRAILWAITTFAKAFSKIGSWFGKIATAIGSFWESISGWAGKIGGLVTRAKTWMMGVESIGSTMKLFGTVFSWIGEVFGKMFSLLGKFTPVLKILGRVAGYLAGPLVWIMVLIDFIQGFLIGFSEGGNLFTAIREGLLNILAGLLNMPKMLLTALAWIFGLDEYIPIIEKYSDMMVNFVIDFFRGFINLAAMIVQNVWEFAKSMARSVLKFLGLDKLADSDFLKESTKSVTEGGGKINAQGEYKKKDKVPDKADNAEGKPGTTKETSGLAGLFSDPEAVENDEKGKAEMAKPKGKPGTTTETKSDGWLSWGVPENKTANLATSSEQKSSKDATDAIRNKGAAPPSPIVVAVGGGGQGAASTVINNSSTNANITPIVPLFTRNQEVVLNRIYEGTYSFRT